MKLTCPNCDGQAELAGYLCATQEQIFECLECGYVTRTVRIQTGTIKNALRERRSNDTRRAERPADDAQERPDLHRATSD